MSLTSGGDYLPLSRGVHATMLEKKNDDRESPSLKSVHATVLRKNDGC